MTTGNTRAIGVVVVALLLAALGACAKGVSDAGFEPSHESDLAPDATSALPNEDPSGAVSASDAAFARLASPDAPTLPTDAALGFDAADDDRGNGVEAAPGVGDPPYPDAADGKAALDGAGGTAANDALDVSASDGSDATNSLPNVSAASPGDLLITEIMFAPWGPEPQSEWFEIYNTTNAPKLLSGLTIEDGYPRTHVVAVSPAVIAPPQMYVLFVRDRAIAIANAIPDGAIAYEYGAGLSAGEGIDLENGATGALSLWNGATELANVPYGPWELASYGQSIELASLQYVGSDTVDSWCLAQYPWAGGSDDGTPGGDNDCP